MELEPQYTSDPSVLNQVQVIAADGSRVPLSAFTRYDYSVIDDRVRHTVPVVYLWLDRVRLRFKRDKKVPALVEATT